MDFINLLLLLIPGLLILLVSFFNLPLRRLWKRDSFKFLVIGSISVIGGGFIFDPKLGMPRDWDLFSFIALPISILLYHSLISNSKKLPGMGTIILLSVSLGFLSLIPRAVVQADEDASVALFNDYIRLDKIKNRTSRVLLVKFYNDKKLIQLASKTFVEWKDDFPEENILKEGIAKLSERKIDEAYNLVNRALSLNPAYGDAYGILGMCMVEYNKQEAAIEPLEICVALNPSNSVALNTLGLVYTYLKKYDMAEKYLLKAVSIDTLGFKIYYNIYKFYKLTGRNKNLFHFLKKSSEKKDAPLHVLQELLNYYLINKQYSQAASFINSNLVIKYDSLYISKLVDSYPDLKSALIK